MSESNGKALEKPKSLQGYLVSIEPELAKALPRGMSAARMVKIVLTELRLNPKLRECTWQSVLGAVFTVSQLGLEPIGGQAYFVPFKKECVLIVGYQGYAQLFYRHQDALTLIFETVREGDDFTFQMGTNAYLNHVPKGNGKPTHYYTIAKLKNGESVFKVMTREQCMAHGKKHSKSFGKPDSPWTKSSDIMCLKTTLLQLKKTLPLSYETQRAFLADESIRNYVPGTTDFTELPNTAWQEVSSGEAENKNEEPPPIETKAKPKSEKQTDLFGGTITDNMKLDLHERMKAHFGSDEGEEAFLLEYTKGWKKQITNTSQIQTEIEFNGIKEAFRAVQDEKK